MALTLEHPSQTQLYWYNDDLMTSNTIGAFRWNARGSPGFLDIVNSTLRDFGVSIYTVMDGRPKLTSQAPGLTVETRKSLVSERDPDVSGRPHQVAVGRDQLELGDGFFQGYREDLRRTQGHHAP